MATNKILPWAQTGTANVLSDDAYAADVATGGLYGDGVKTGQASSQQANKTWRQATAPGSGLGQFLVDNLSVDVTDSDTPATFSSRIANAILKLAQISPFNQSWAVATGGYRKYAIVSDSSGDYWSSTADQNTTVPGASGTKWQSLFNGYATEAWANGQFLKLADSAEQTVSGPVTFSGVFSKDAPAGSNAQIQVTAGGSDRWNFGRDAAAESGTSTGSNFLIARFDNSGNYIDSPFGINRETGVVSANVGMEVPDISTFTSKNALNAGTAEGRYVKSVPAAGQTRITSLVENSDGRAVLGDGTNSPVLANLDDLPFSDPTQKIQAFTAYVKFENGITSITFPRAFKEGTVPTVILPSTQEQSNKWTFLGILIQSNGQLAISNTGVSIYGVGWAGGSTFAKLRQNNLIPVVAIGEF